MEDPAIETKWANESTLPSAKVISGVLKCPVERHLEYVRDPGCFEV